MPSCVAVTPRRLPGIVIPRDADGVRPRARARVGWPQVAPAALAAGRAAALSTSSPVARRPIAVAARRVDLSTNLVALVSRSSSPGKLRHAAVATDAAPTAPPAADTLTYVDTHCHLDLAFQKMTSEAKKGKKGDAAVVNFDSWRHQLMQLEDPDPRELPRRSTGGLPRRVQPTRGGRRPGHTAETRRVRGVRVPPACSARVGRGGTWRPPSSPPSR